MRGRLEIVLVRNRIVAENNHHPLTVPSVNERLENRETNMSKRNLSYLMFLVPVTIPILFGIMIGTAVRLDREDELQRASQNIVYYDCIVTMESGQIHIIETSTKQDPYYTRTWPGPGLKLRDKDGMDCYISGNITSIIKKSK